MKRFMSAETAAGPMVEVCSNRMKTIAVDDGSAMRDVRVVVVDDSPAVMPIESPVVPTPSEAAKQPNAESQPETDPRAGQEEPRIRIPTGKDRQRSPINHPGIILRYV